VPKLAHFLKILTRKLSFLSHLLSYSSDTSFLYLFFIFMTLCSGTISPYHIADARHPVSLPPSEIALEAASSFFPANPGKQEPMPCPVVPIDGAVKTSLLTEHSIPKQVYRLIILKLASLTVVLI
jgi:hypothetical protein